MVYEWLEVGQALLHARARQILASCQTRLAWKVLSCSKEAALMYNWPKIDVDCQASCLWKFWLQGPCIWWHCNQFYERMRKWTSVLCIKYSVFQFPFWQVVLSRLMSLLRRRSRSRVSLPYSNALSLELSKPLSGNAKVLARGSEKVIHCNCAIYRRGIVMSIAALLRCRLFEWSTNVQNLQLVSASCWQSSFTWFVFSEILLIRHITMIWIDF